MKGYKAKELAAIAEILKAYTSDEEGPWSIGYSGGKDSTVTAALVFKALLMLKPEQRKRKIYIVSAQTNLDLTTDPTKQKEFERMQKVIDRQALPIELKEVEAEMEQSFLYLVLGKGYPLPKNKMNKWCTDRLKLKPQEEFMNELNPVLTLIGVRISESQQRAASIAKHQNSKYYGDGTMMPIVDFILTDVWDYLREEQTPWGDAEEISQIYKDATSECGLRGRKAGADENNSDACGARFGCVICPVVKIDKSTRETAKRKPWFQPYAELRDQMIQMYKEPENKAGYMRNGKYLGYGTFTVKARMKLLDLFEQAEDDHVTICNMYNVEPQRILTEELLEKIHEAWKKDLDENPHLEDGLELGEFYEEKVKRARAYQITWNSDYEEVKE